MSLDHRDPQLLLASLLGDARPNRKRLSRVWPLWFGFDNVFPSPDHVPYLHHRFDVQTFSEHTAPMPYAPGVRTPYYRFIGQKPQVGLD